MRPLPLPPHLQEYASHMDHGYILFYERVQ